MIIEVHNYYYSKQQQPIIIAFHSYDNYSYSLYTGAYSIRRHFSCAVKVVMRAFASLEIAFKSAS